MGSIYMTGGPVVEADGPVNSAVSETQFTTCSHCQATIKFVSDVGSPFRVGKLESDHQCVACNNKPICVMCGNDQLSGVPCPGPFWMRARSGLV